MGQAGDRVTARDGSVDRKRCACIWKTNEGWYEHGAERRARGRVGVAEDARAMMCESGVLMKASCF